MYHYCSLCLSFSLLPLTLLQEGSGIIWFGLVTDHLGVTVELLFFVVKSLRRKPARSAWIFFLSVTHTNLLLSGFFNTHMRSYSLVGSIHMIDPVVNWQSVLINVNPAGDHRSWNTVTHTTRQNKSFVTSITFDGKYIFLRHHVSFGSHCNEEILKCCLQHSRLVMHASVKAQFRAFQAKLSQHPDFSALLKKEVKYKITILTLLTYFYAL